MSDSFNKASCITIGNFDGVHLGHQSLIALAKKVASDKVLPLQIITFWPHPRAVLKGPEKHKPLLERQEKLRLLAEHGIANLLELPFTLELASMSADAFVRHQLLPLGIKELVVGHDFTLGRKREGDFDRLIELGSKYGFNVTQAPAFMIDGEPVSSTRLRNLISAGEMSAAAVLLGRNYSLLGKVARGFGRGKSLGYPTANLSGFNTLLPANGVYATFAHLCGQVYPAVTNIGKNPTFGNKTVSVETFLLDVNKDLYGEDVQLEFVSHIRQERKFASGADLAAQISEDIEAARSALLCQPKSI